MKYEYKNLSLEDISKYIKKWSWQELTYGLSNNFTNKREIIKYAKLILSDNTCNFDNVLQLAITKEDEDIDDILENLVKNEEQEVVDFIKEKWLYVLMHYLFDNKEKYEDVLEIVECIYADFDYPTSISSIVRYMPIQNDDNKKDNYPNESLYFNWNNYLLNSKKNY